MKKTYCDGNAVAWIAILIGGIALLFAGGTFWYVMQTARNVEEVSSNINNQVVQLGQQVNAIPDEKRENSWQSYSNEVYSVEFPVTWFYKLGLGTSTPADVFFAPTLAQLPADMTDDIGVIEIDVERVERTNITSDPSKMTQQQVTLGDHTFTKITLLPGRTSDMQGDQKEVWYVLPFANGYIYISNMNDEELATFEHMVSTIELI